MFRHSRLRTLTRLLGIDPAYFETAEARGRVKPRLGQRADSDNLPFGRWSSAWAGRFVLGVSGLLWLMVVGAFAFAFG